VWPAYGNVYNEQLVDYILCVLCNVTGLFYLPRQYTHASLNGPLVTDCDFANRPYALLNELGIDLIEVLPKLIENCFIVFIIDNPHQYFSTTFISLHLLVLNIVRIGKPTEKAFDLVLKEWRSFLYDVLYIFEDHKLYLSGREGDNWHNWRCNLFG
jgi:hypothetical protein